MRRVDLDNRADRADGHAEGTEHALGVISRYRWLLETCNAVGIQARQQDGAFYLSACHGAFVLQRGELTVFGQRPHDKRSNDVIRACGMRSTLDDGTSRTQGSGNSHHRSPRQGRVADERRLEALRREHAAQETHRRARIAAVEISHGRPEAVETDAVDDQLGGAGFLDDDAHRAQAAGGRDVVFAVREAGDMRCALTEGTKEEGSVPDALVGGYGNAADKRLRRGMND